jgi:hypothetical protein
VKRVVAKTTFWKKVGPKYNLIVYLKSANETGCDKNILLKYSLSQIYINIFFYRIVQFLMDKMVINVGIKNVNIYKSPQWTTCVIQQNNRVYKHIYAETLLPGVPYPIAIEKHQGLPSLLCDHMIIHQQERWFEYQLVFTLTNYEAGERATFFEYRVKED